jgi:hypothetical protein
MTDLEDLLYAAQAVLESRIWQVACIDNALFLIEAFQQMSEIYTVIFDASPQLSFMEHAPPF